MFVDHHWQEWLTVLGYITLAGIVTWQIFARSR